jgi:hypothetical protein
MIVLIIVIGVVIYKHQIRDEAADVPQSGNADTPAGDDAAPVSPPTEVPVVIMQDGVRTEGTLKMTQGLQVYDANGHIILDVTDRLTRIIDTFDVAGTARNMVTTNKTYTLPSDKHNLWIHMVDMDTSKSGNVDYTMSRTDDVTVLVQIASGRKTKIIVGVY